MEGKAVYRKKVSSILDDSFKYLWKIQVLKTNDGWIHESIFVSPYYFFNLEHVLLYKSREK